MVETSYRNELNRGAHPVADAAHHTQEVRDHAERPAARALEERTARIGSDGWLWASVGAMGLSLLLQLTGRQPASLIVGQWAAPFMLIGVYSKLVRVAGPDRLAAT